jgi:three-Cys-motif partner protein
MANALQSFGGDWTQEKLERVRKYLAAYTQIMKNRHFTFSYIDAFAGTGYRTVKVTDDHPRLPELCEEDSTGFLDGSARIALQVRPPFSRHFFIEKDKERCAELERLKVNFPSLSRSINVVNAEANGFLAGFCRDTDWRKNRAVLFLDPFGMEVSWETIVAIAETKAIDLWLLFPLGVAVNRMLKKDGQISAAWRERLNSIFGATDWYDAFYRETTSRDTAVRTFQHENHTTCCRVA